MTKNPMKNLPASAPDTVDVVAESNYGTTSEAYNKAFRTWRSSEKNEYAFRCRKRTKEAVYVEGKGYHEPDPAAEERRAIMQINMVIGMALFAFLLIENLLTALLMGAAQLIGLDVGYCYSDGTVYGNQTAVLAILMLKTILKYLVPILIFRLTFRMPRRVAFHLKPDAPREFPATIAVTLIIFAVTNVWMLFSPINFLSNSTLGEAYYTVSYMRPSYQMVYLVFELLTVSICKELFLHGEVLHVLRQFGDWYAIILTAILAVCVSHSWTTILMELTFSIVSGIAVLRSGSLIPSIFCRMLYHVMLFGLFAMEIWPNQTLQAYRPLFLFLVLLVGILLCLLSIRPTRKSPALLTQKHLPFHERTHLYHHAPGTAERRVLSLHRSDGDRGDFLTETGFVPQARYMMRALDLAKQAAAMGEVPVGAVVVQKSTGRIIGEGYNRREIDRSPLAHAEIMAIDAASRNLGGWRLLGQRIVCDPGAMPHVCRSDPARTAGSGRLRRI